jgi:hypothetical protein
MGEYKTWSSRNGVYGCGLYSDLKRWALVNMEMIIGVSREAGNSF